MVCYVTVCYEMLTYSVMNGSMPSPLFLQQSRRQRKRMLGMRRAWMRLLPRRSQSRSKHRAVR
jgi:hypothetical protein